MATPNQQFCLRWNNHQPNFIAVFSTLLRSESMCDVTLATEGKHILAHKIVLSACSSYFQMLFAINPCKHPIVILKDVQFKDLKTLIDFVYFGEVNVSQEHLPSLLKTAETLQIKGLTEMPDRQVTLNSIPSSASTPQPGGSGGGEIKTESPLGSPSGYKRKRMRKSSAESVATTVGGEDQETSTINTRDIQQSGQHMHGVMVKPEPHGQPTPQLDDKSPRSVSMSSAETGPISGNKSGWVEPAHVINIYSAIDPSPAPSSHYQEGEGFSSEFTPEATPPLTARKKRYNSCSSQDRERFNEALEAVRYGGIGFCKAARLYGVNNRSLWLEYKKRGYPTMRPGPKLKSKDPAVAAQAAAAAAASAAAQQQQQQQQGHHQQRGPMHHQTGGHNGLYGPQPGPPSNPYHNMMHSYQQAQAQHAAALQVSVCPCSPP
uniref:Protein tramtrack, alpha isoform n=1 Tax=Cacopsylla melanoneura TaxID=428564 RepID=A0A8D8WKS5_9HEMI